YYMFLRHPRYTLFPYTTLFRSIIYDRDFGYDYFGFKTLERSYLLRMKGKLAERPQHMIMRVAVGIHKNDIEAAIRTYHLMSEKRSEEHTSELQSRENLVCRLLL